MSEVPGAAEDEFDNIYAETEDVVTAAAGNAVIDQKPAEAIFHAEPSTEIANAIPLTAPVGTDASLEMQDIKVVGDVNGTADPKLVGVATSGAAVVPDNALLGEDATADRPHEDISPPTSADAKAPTIGKAIGTDSAVDEEADIGREKGQNGGRDSPLATEIITSPGNALYGEGNAALEVDAITNGASDTEIANEKQKAVPADGPGQEQDVHFLAAAEANRNNPEAEWQYDSSDMDTSSSESDTESSSDESDEADGDYEMLDPIATAKMLMAEEGGEDEDGQQGGSGIKSSVRTKNEKEDEVVPKPDINVTEDMKIMPLGMVEHVVDKTAVVKAFTPGEYQVLETGSALCLENRVVIGAVMETLGRVQEPMYTIAFTNAAEMQELGVEVGSKIFYVEEHSSYVFTEPLRGMKGTDASNIHDEEAGDDEMEFSDDEMEAAWKRYKKTNRRGDRQGFLQHLNSAPKQSRDDFRDAKEERVAIKYDDSDNEDMYTPLARPTDYSAMMVGERQAPKERMRRNDTDRGRGRGGRGRGGHRGDRGNRGRRGGFGAFSDQGVRQDLDSPQQSLSGMQYGQTRNAFPPQAPQPSAAPMAYPGHQYPQQSPNLVPPPPPGWPTQWNQQPSWMHALQQATTSTAMPPYSAPQYGAQQHGAAAGYAGLAGYSTGSYTNPSVPQQHTEYPATGAYGQFARPPGQVPDAAALQSVIQQMYHASGSQNRQNGSQL